MVGDNYLVPPAILRKGMPALSVANETCESILERQSLREEMDESSKDIEEEEEAGNPVQDIYTYLTERHYPPLCGPRKRAIRRKATKFVIHDGELFFQKQEKARDGTKARIPMGACAGFRAG